MNQDFDPVLAAFRIFDRDHSSTLSSDELKYFLSQLPDLGSVRNFASNENSRHGPPRGPRLINGQ